MSGTVGGLQVILELNDGDFNTRVVRAGQTLQQFERQAQVTVNVTNRLSSTVRSAGASFAEWTVALGQARNALENIHSIFGSWIEKIVEVNSHIEQTVTLMAGFSQAATQAERLAEGMETVQRVMKMAASTPFRLDALHESFVRLRTAGLDPLQGSLQALTDAIASFGGDDEKLKRAAYAVQDMAGKGVISLEELRRQLGQHIPNAMQLLARAMNMTTSELIQAVTRGTLESRNAIQLLMDEFDRTFAGAAARRMETFMGAMAQLRTEMMHLSQVAVGMQIGAPADSSFYRELVKTIRELSEYMQGGEANAAAITINEKLKSMLDTSKQLANYLPSLNTIINETAFAFKVLAAAIAGNLLITGIGVVTASVTRAIAGFQNIVTLVSTLGTAFTLIGPAISSAASALSGFGASLLASISGVSAATAATTGLAGGIAGLVAGFAAIAVPTAILAGIAAIVYSLGRLKGQAEITGEALNRIRLGDVTQDNEKAAKSELQQLEDKIATLRRFREAALLGTSNRLPIPNVEGFAGSPTLRSPYRTPGATNEPFGVLQSGEVTRDRKRALQEYADAALEQITRLENEIRIRRQELENVPLQRMNAQAQQFARSMVAQVEIGLTAVTQKYDETQRDIAERLKTAETNRDVQEQKRLNEESKASVKENYDGQLAAYSAMLDRMRALRDSSDGQQRANAEAAINLISQKYDEVARKADEAFQRHGIVKTIDSSKTYNKLLEEAATDLQTMGRRAAELNARLEQTGTYVARVKQAFSETGKYADLGYGSEQYQEMIKLAEGLDRTTQSLRAWQNASEAQNRISLGFDKANAELDGVITKITDPRVPEAQRNFVIFQNQINEALLQMAASIDFGKLDQFLAFLQAADVAMAAIQAKSISTLLTGVQSLGEQINSRWLASLPAAARATEEYAQSLKKINDFRAEANAKLALPTLTPEQRNALTADLKALDDMEHKIGGIKGNQLGRAGATAARPSQNAIQQLAGRLAEINAQIVDGGSEYAKWMAMIEASPGKYSAAKDQILAYAQQIDEATKKLRLARQAMTAFNNIENARDQEEQAAAISASMMGTGRLLDIERQLIEFKAKSAYELGRIARAPNADQLLPDALKIADEAEAFFGTRLVRQRVEANNTEALSLRKSFADTLAARREAGEKEIAYEQTKMQNLIAMYITDADERKRLEDNLATYIATKHEELERKTENSLQRMGREWSDMSAQIADFGAQALDGFIDTLVEKLATGKASWTDFADWAIKELIRIQLRSAVAPIAKAFGDVGGIGGFLGDFVGSIFGKGSKTTPEPVISSSGVFHSGGIVSSFATTMRSLPDAIFANAPRFHSGGMLGPNERPAILEYGEGVFNKNQLSVIGRMNHSYSYVENALGVMSGAMLSIAASANKVPSYVAPASNYDVSNTRVGQSNSPVTINVNNQSNQPISATAGTARFDGEQMVIDVVIRNIQSPGPLRDAVRGIR